MTEQNKISNRVKVAINGFGRIGRAFFKLSARNPNIEIVAINDLADKENLEYLLKYDSVYGIFSGNLGGVEFFQEKNPINLPWRSLGVDVVVESTGVFRTREKASTHIQAGAKRVVISAPTADVQTVLMGVNEDKIKENKITCNASCTTNAASPVLFILDETLGVEAAILNTIHAYTATQSTVDRPNRDLRKGRSAAVNIVPTSTGAAIATTKALTQLEDKFDGVALRVPVPCGSIADITFIAKRPTTKEEVNTYLTNAAESARWKSIFAITEEQLVSSDIIGRPKSAIADLSMTRVVNGNLVKVLAWYDNEVGYASSLLAHVLATGNYKF